MIEIFWIGSMDPGLSLLTALIASSADKPFEATRYAARTVPVLPLISIRHLTYKP
jgi:hypothetical protein